MVLYFDCVSAYPRIHFTIYLEVYLGRSGIFDCVSAYPCIHLTTYYLEVYLGRGGTFDCVSAYPLHNIPSSLFGEGWYFRLRIRVSTYPLYNIPRSLLGEEWYFPLRIRVSAYPLHNILLRSLLGEGWYFRLRIRVSSLFRGAASKWQGILQLLRKTCTCVTGFSVCSYVCENFSRDCKAFLLFHQFPEVFTEFGVFFICSCLNDIWWFLHLVLNSVTVRPMYICTLAWYTMSLCTHTP